MELKCKSQNQESYYIGNVNKANKKTCIPWNTVKINGEFPHRSITHNYCRDVDNDKNDTFCYVLGKGGKQVKEKCKIPDCAEPLALAKENEHCEQLNEGTLKWAKEGKKVHCSKKEVLEILREQTFQECAINCQFETNCMFFQLKPDENDKNITNCNLMRNLINCHVDLKSGFETWSKKYCFIKLYPFNRNNEICLTLNKNSSNEIRNCEEVTHSLKWVKDDKVSCTSNNVSYTQHTVENANQCLSKCQDDKSCQSIEISEVNGKSKKNKKMLCVIKQIIEICHYDKNSTAQRYWIGCCKKLGEIVALNKPRSDCVHEGPVAITKTNYIGEQNSSSSGKKCLPWNEINLMTENQYVNVSIEHSFCRNFNYDSAGPWCVVSGSFMMEYCTVPYCANDTDKANNKVICYVRSDEEKNGNRCNRPLHNVNWAEDKSVYCYGNRKELFVVEDATAEECIIKCQNIKSCESFEMENRTGGRTKCHLLSNTRICKVVENGNPRWSIACCRALEVSSPNTQYNNLQQFDKCIRTKDTIYIGDISTTVENKPCQPWTAIEDTLKNASYPFKGMEHNYCRNINSLDSGTWCIVSGSTFYELCLIPHCDKEEEYATKEDVCLAKITDNCPEDYKLLWVMDQSSNYCTEINADDELITADFISKCRETCLKNNCYSIRIIPTYESKFDCYMKTNMAPCNYTRGTSYKRLWRGCCKPFRPLKPNVDLFPCFSERYANNFYDDGIISKSRSGTNCLKWSDIRSNVDKKYFPKSMNDIPACFNLNGDENGPWCLTNGYYGFEYCSVEKCPILLETAADGSMTCLRGIVNDRKQCSDINFALKWVLDKNVYCHIQQSAFLKRQNIDLLKCKKWCADGEKKCYSLTFENGVCSMYAVILSCKPVKEDNLVKVSQHWYIGCCRELKPQFIQDIQIENKYYRIQLLTASYVENFIYMGKNSLNDKCIQWNLAQPNLTGTDFPDGRNDHNYCRNINFDRNGPWCFVSGTTLIEYCTEDKDNSTSFILQDQVTLNDICYEDSLPKRQTKCSRPESKLKWVAEDQVSCKIDTKTIIKEINVYGITDCKVTCFLNKECVSLYFEERSEEFNYEPIHKCTLSKTFSPCVRNYTSRNLYLTIACCNQLTLPEKGPEETRIERDCVHLSLKFSATSIDYIGTVNKTATGKKCLKWSNLKRFDLPAHIFPKKRNSHNYCRNLNNDPYGPWCFTTGKFIYEHCKPNKCVKLKDLPLCKVPVWFISLVSISWTLTCICLGFMLYLYYRNSYRYYDALNRK